MVNYGHGTVGYVLTLISLIHGLFASVISFMVIVIIIHHQYNNRLKREKKITLVLSTYIYLFLFIYIITLVSCNIQTLIGDVYGNNFNSSWCIFRGYFIAMICCALYHSFVIQAFFRLCRIVYSKYRWLQFFWFYVIIVPIQVIGASILLCPILIWQEVVYLPNDHYCFTPFSLNRGILWMVFICYGLPLLYLSLMYILITLFIRRQSSNLLIAIRQRQKRDLITIQRIFINVGLLMALGLPGIVVLIMSFITGVEYPLAYRIVWIGAEVSVAILSVEMILMTPQLKHIVMRRWQRNRVAINQGSLQMRPVTTVA